MRAPLALYGGVLCVCFAPILSAQDAAKVDPKHYTVVSENAQVRTGDNGMDVIVVELKGKAAMPAKMEKK